MTTINSAEIDARVAAIVAKVEKTQQPATFRKALIRTGVLIEDIMREEPKKAKGAFTAMASPAQRRAYWAKVRDNPAIHDPNSGYIRRNSAALWRYETTPTKVTISNPVDHGQYVWKGPPRPMQQGFLAASKWPRGDNVLKREADTIVGFFEQALRKALD